MSWLIVETEEDRTTDRLGLGLIAGCEPRCDRRRRRPTCQPGWTAMSAPVWVWGLPLSPMTRGQAAEAVMALIEAGRPSFFITANAHYAMLTAERPELRPINDRAAFLLADGAPLVWASRRGPTPLPERVAGSDLVYDLCEHAARLGRGVYLLGGGRGGRRRGGPQAPVASIPGLRIVGTACPPPGSLVGRRVAGRLIAEIRASQARPPAGRPRPAQGGTLARRAPRRAGRAGLRPGRRDARLRRRPGPPGASAASRRSAWNGPSGSTPTRPGWPPAMPGMRCSSSGTSPGS